MFRRLFGKKKPKELLCSICGKSVYLTAEFQPPGIVVDYSKGKAYTICGFCQYRLDLKLTESGYLIHEIRDGFGYVDIDRIERLIVDGRSSPGKNVSQHNEKPRDR